MADVRPPTRGCFSTTVTSSPALASNMAVASPPGPAPTINTRFDMTLYVIDPHRACQYGMQACGAGLVVRALACLWTQQSSEHFMTG